MKIDNILNFYTFLSTDGQDYKDPAFQEIKEKYNIKDINEKISVSNAIAFIRDVFEINFYFYDKFIRYARMFNLLIEEDKKQRNWKLSITYENIFKLMFMPLCEYFKMKEKS